MQSRKRAFFNSPAQVVKTFDPYRVGPDNFQVISHAIDRVCVSLPRTLRRLAGLRGGFKGSAQAMKEFRLCFCGAGGAGHRRTLSQSW